MDHYTVGKTVDHVSDDLRSRLSSKHLTLPNHDRFLDIATKFQERWSFPYVIGCFDGKHTVLQIQTVFSIVLEDIADSERRFIFIDVDTYGKQSDGGTFSASTLYHFLEDSESTLPKPASFEGSGTAMPFVILGDEVYP
ncbi:hypothetical protein Cfor_11699 [Coptotermes formosanus]|jgi:hypothetical protein|uniref:DDE Tnp4 domain-containing protein n=1 Tax=Coptotermes formosanus TaxID=36987 RepID=A0A6L2P8I7_COPFO|nr:hypothetical protein Cfor_11699 [Coptotermes formosanus]